MSTTESTKDCEAMFETTLHFRPCDKCKSNNHQKQCFSPDCEKVRCISCVESLLKKIERDELRDEDDEMVYVCTKVCAFVCFVQIICLCLRCSNYNLNIQYNIAVPL